MTVTATNAFTAATGNGSTTAFPFTFFAPDQSQINVYVNGVLQVSGWTAVCNAGAGGTVTFSTAPAPGDEIQIALNPNFQQSTAFSNTGAYLPSTQDAALDQAAARDIYLLSLLNRAPLAPLGETIGLIPQKSLRVGMYAAWDAQGNLVGAAGTGAGDTNLRTDLASSVSGAAIVAYSASETVKQGLDRVAGSNEILLGNPTRTAGIAAFGADGLGTLANQREAYSLTGTRSGPMVGRSIEISDGQTGPASSSGVSSADSASYAQSLVNVRLNWTTSAQTGECDGQNVFVRQGQGDASCWLGNLGIRNGFGCQTEGFTFSADSTGATVKAVRVQSGVVNPRDGGEFGFVSLAATGTDLFGGFVARDQSGGNWLYPFCYLDPSGNVLWQVRKTDGAMIGGSLTPRVSRGAQVGTSLLDYANVYSMLHTMTPAPLATLGTAAANEGAIAYCNDVSGTPAVGASVTGGGTGKNLIFSNGTNWLRVV